MAKATQKPVAGTTATVDQNAQAAPIAAEEAKTLSPYSFGESASDDVLAELENNGNEIHNIPFEQISVKQSFNPRDFGDDATGEHLAKLVTLIEDAGRVVKPLDVTVETDLVDPSRKRIAIQDGETRYRAVAELRRKYGNDAFPTLPVLVQNGLAPVDQALQFIQANAGKGFTAFEQVNLMQTLRNQGNMTYDAAAERMHFSKAHLLNTLKWLVFATENMRELVRKGSRPGGMTATDLAKDIKEAVENIPATDQEGQRKALLALEAKLVKASKARIARNVSGGRGGGPKLTQEEIEAGVTKAKKKTDHQIWLENYGGGGAAKNIHAALVDGIREALNLMVPLGQFHTQRVPLLKALQGNGIPLEAPVVAKVQEEAAQVAAEGSGQPAK